MGQIKIFMVKDFLAYSHGQRKATHIPVGSCTKCGLLYPEFSALNAVLCKKFAI